MSVQILKYTIQIVDRPTLTLPASAKILSVQMQNGVPCVWALVDPGTPEHTRVLELYVTGEEISQARGLAFIGTFQDGPYVGHLFERHWSAELIRHVRDRTFTSADMVKAVLVETHGDVNLALERLHAYKRPT